MSDSATFSLPNNDWTFAVWLYITSLSGTGYQFVLSHGYDSWEEFSSLIIHNSDDSMEAYVGCGTGNGDVSVRSAANAVVVNTLQHWIMSRESGALKLYKNAVLLGSDSPATFGGCNPAGDICFGIRDNLTGSRVSGSMSEVAFWNRALRQDEKNQLLYYTADTIPGAIVWNQTLRGESVVDRIQSISATPVGSPTVVDHPPLIMRG